MAGNCFPRFIGGSPCFSLNNYAISGSEWLNLTLKLTLTPVIPHIKAILSSGSFVNELMYILSPVKYAYVRIWLNYYVAIKDNRTVDKLYNSVFPGSMGA